MPRPEKPATDPVQAFRRARLQALIASPPYNGVLAALGRALEYQDGVFVRQMRDGERPISEKTVAKIEAVHPGWFADEPSEAVPVSETDFTMLLAFQEMLEDDRQQMLADALNKAETAKRVYQEAIAKFTPKGTAAPDAFMPGPTPAPRAPFKLVRKSRKAPKKTGGRTR